MSTQTVDPKPQTSANLVQIGSTIEDTIQQRLAEERARLERQWRIAQEQADRGELLEAEVIDFNKGGLIVNLDGIRGFVPISQILNLKREDNADNAETQQKLQAMVGRKLQLKIIEINRNRNRLCGLRL